MKTRMINVYQFAYPLKGGMQIEFTTFNDDERTSELKVRNPTVASRQRLQKVLTLGWYDDTPDNVTNSVSIQTDGIMSLTSFVRGRIIE